MACPQLHPALMHGSCCLRSSHAKPLAQPPMVTVKPALSCVAFRDADAGTALVVDGTRSAVQLDVVPRLKHSALCKLCRVAATRSTARPGPALRPYVVLPSPSQLSVDLTCSLRFTLRYRRWPGGGSKFSVRQGLATRLCAALSKTKIACH